MKRALLPLILAVLLLAMHSDNTDNKNLLCHLWKQVAIKSHNDSAPKKVEEGPFAKICEFKADGSYNEDMFKLKSGGKWYLNPDQTKFEITINSFNGQSMREAESPTHHYNHIILKLTKDSLIFGDEKYYGAKGIYGHDDWYFVRRN